MLRDLAKNYEDIDTDGTLDDAFRNIAKQLAKEYYEDNHRDIMFRAENSSLEPGYHHDFAGTQIEDADDSALHTSFEEVLANSVAYVAMARCGLDPGQYFEEADFQGIIDFNTADMANAIGVASSDLSEQVLRDVETVIRRFEKAILASQHRHERNRAAERSVTHERNLEGHGVPNLHAGGRLSSPQYPAERAAEGDNGPAGSLREDAQSLSQGAPTDSVQPPAPIGEPLSPSEGSGRGGSGEDVAGDGGTDFPEQLAGNGSAARQDHRPDGLDSSDERTESPGGGNGASRADLRIEDEPGAADDAAPFAAFEPEATPMSQPPAPTSRLAGDPGGNSSLEEILSTSAISLAEVDAILRDGGNSRNSNLRIAAHFSKALDDNTAFLRREYLQGRWGRDESEAGKGFDFGTGPGGSHGVCAWFDAQGISLAIGITAKHNIHRITIPWDAAAARINEMMLNGEYVSRNVLRDALDNEQKELAEHLWYFYRDDMGKMPEEWRAGHGGFPDDVAIIQDFLADFEERQMILAHLEEDVAELETRGSGRHWHDHQRLLGDMRDYTHPDVISPADAFTWEAPFSHFITQDEIDSFLTRGGNYSEGKLQTLSYFLNDHSDKEKADFVKERHGHGGGTWVATDGWHDSLPGKGITLSRGTYDKRDCSVNLKWPAAAKRIEALIHSGHFATQNDLDAIPNYERLILVRSVNTFYCNLPDEYERPFPGKNGVHANEFHNEDGKKTLDFFYPHDAEWEAIRSFLEDTERIDSTLSQMQRIFENTSTEDRYYDTRKPGYEMLSAYRNGTYTLFPGIEKLPEPGTPMFRRIEYTRREIVEDMRESPGFQIGEQQSLEQMSIFGGQLPILPSVEEQQAKIEVNQPPEPVAEVETPTPAISMPNPLLDISDPDKVRLVAQFAVNPRSRETVQLVREIYGDNLGIPVPQAIKEISEWIAKGTFEVLEPEVSTPDLSDIEQMIDPIPDTPSESEAVSFDFEAVADEIYEQVLNDAAFVEALSNAASRGALRRPLNTALDAVIAGYENETQMHAYLSGDDIADYLFDYIYRKAWDEREVAAEPLPPVFEEITDPEILAEAEKIFGAAPSGENADLAGAKALIADFTENEYGSAADFQNLESIGIAYTTTEDEKHEIQVDADLLSLSMKYYLDDTLVKTDQYATLQELIEVELKNLNFDDLITVAVDLADLDEQEAAIAASDKPQPVAATPALNFRITDDHLGEGGAKTKFRANINALKTLKALEAQNSNATPAEQEVLSRYIGWGGLPQAFDPENKDWANEYAELKAILTDDEFASARASTLNAHYTSPTIIKAMWETIERMGFEKGNVLEPSMGVGNFYGLIPDSMRDSKLYGVELDSVTARIAQKLYPDANIQQTGFENTTFPDAFFDLAIGNVPFGDYGVMDKRYDKHKFSIHNYFFAKSLDQVRPGGVVAFLTSKFTMDSKDPSVRKYLAERAELLGAVRLPNDAFLKNAGTETTMDILFLQKRDRPLDIEPEWVHLGLTEEEIPVNRYFLDNPEMVCGTIALDERMNNKFGRTDYTACLPIPGADSGEQLRAALSHIEGEYTVTELDDIEGVDTGVPGGLARWGGSHAIPADPDVKNFSYTEVEGTVYFRENSLMYPVDLPNMTLERIRGMIGLRDCVHKLIDLQLEDYPASDIEAQQAKLNDLYDGFIAEFGLVSSTANSRAFNADSAYYLLSSLEILDEDGELERKADMFTKRTIKQKTVITHVDTASEALAVSLGERAKVDMAFMSELTGRSEDELFSELNGVVYKDFFGFPDGKFVYRTADEFLSGNVRKKLNHYRVGLGYTRESHPNYATILDAVTALEAVQPKDLEAGEISVRLGSTWIDPEYVQQFMYQLLDTSWRNQGQYKIHYHKLTGEWQVSGKGRAQYSDIAATVTYGTERMNAYQIIDDTLNLRDVRVYDYKQDADGKDQRILNKKQTTLAQQKQELIKQKFKDWLWQDPERRQTLVRKYNDLFNSVRLREYDGSHITFDGINPEIRLNKHQVDGVARHLYGGNTLYGHVVGAGKTFTMIAAAQESKRLGLCQKSLIAVPNHLTDQWAAEYLRLYPSANILVATKKDFEMRNRKKFCAKIATGDYDAVIVGHSQLEKIPMSRERQERQIREQIWEIEDGLRDLKAAKGERYSIKQLEKTRRGLETRLKKLLESKTRDDVVTFEQLGVDRLFVDESHQFKNLFLYTKMRNVAGLSTSEAQKSSDLFGKCRYLDELTGGKGIVFATGTPISNSMSEMYTVQRYLQYDTLSAKGLTHFDAWASIFGETVTSIELAPEGTGYRARTRFARFHNLPELMAMFREVADIQTADMLGLPVPEAKYENIIVEPSELQQEMVQELSERAAAVHRKEVDPSTDNMLKITTDGRKIGLDQRLINPLLPDFEGSKVNACTDNIHRIWQETSGDRLTQLVFSDFSTPNKDGRFNIYDDIRKKLLERGVPESEIAFIHDADTEVKKKELFAKVRQGKVRILLGSTFKMGAGTNVQDKLVALHDVDCPWRPADLEQRSGRIIRQGNTNDEVQIYRYATSGTFDSYLWQTVQKKQEFIAQIMSSKSPVRSAEDVDETALSYAEIKALCAGNPLIAEKMNLDNEVAKLRMLKAEHKNQHYRLEDNLLGHFPKQITAVTERIGGIEKDIAAYAVEKEKTAQATMTEGAALVENKFPGMTVNGTFHAEKEPASKALLEACKGVKGRNTDVAIGEYMGFQMGLRYESFGQQINLMLRGAMTYQIDLGTDALGNITRINNALEKLPERLAGAQTQLEDLHHQVEAAKLELAKPFEQEQELQAKEARLALLNADLNIDGDGDMDVENDIESRDDDVEFDRDEVFDFEPVRAASYAKARPSIMESLHRYEGDKQSEALGLSKPSERDI